MARQEESIHVPWDVDPNDAQRPRRKEAEQPHPRSHEEPADAAAGADGPPEKRRLNVQFTPEAYAQLQEMARRRGRSVSDTVREALSLDLWFEDQMKAGYSLQLRRSDGATKTVAIPRR